MNTSNVSLFALRIVAAVTLWAPICQAQQLASRQSVNRVVPRLVQFNGAVKDAAGRPVAGLTFALYKDQEGGAAIWTETQNVALDESGRYSVVLGATKTDGLPMELFTSGAARWLGIEPEGQREQSRVLLLSVPYALKAVDAETLGGMPPSAFALAVPPNHGAASESVTSANSPSALTAAVGGTGTTNFIPLWTNSTTLGNSGLFQNGGKVGLGTTTPFAGLHVQMSTTVAVQGTSTSSTGLGVQGSGFVGVRGTSSTSSGSGVTGLATAGAGPAHGVNGVTSSNSGVGVFGLASATTGNTIGMQGQVNSPSGIAIFGDATATTGTAIGVEGKSAAPGAAGVYGIGVNVSATGASILGSNTSGVWGDTGQSPTPDIGVLGTSGVVGTADDGIGVFGLTNPGTDTLQPAVLANNISTTKGTYAFWATGGSLGGSCTVDVSGNLACTGSKSAVVSVDNGNRSVALYAVEAPENWFEDFGSGKLVAGAVTITVDSTFLQTVNTNGGYHVFLTPNGDCQGLYVASKTSASFEVRELNRGQSNVPFDYRIVARRRGYESVRLMDMTQSVNQMRAQISRLSRAPARTEDRMSRQSRNVLFPAK